MNALGAIAARLAFTSEPVDQHRLLTGYLAALDPAERESAARLLGEPSWARRIRLSALRNIVREQQGEQLYALSLDFVSETTETIALLWQPRPGSNRPPLPSDILQGMAELGPTKRLRALHAWLDACDVDGRHFLIRLATGSLKPPASVHVLTRAFASAGVQFQPSEQPGTRLTSSQPDLFETKSVPHAG